MSKTETNWPSTPVEKRVSLCWLRVGERLFGIETREIREVLGPKTLQEVPLAPAFLAGVLPYRGEVLTAVSLRCLLGLKPDSKQGSVLVLDTGGDHFGLVVDRVGGVVEVESKTLARNPATLDERSKALFRGAYRVPQGLLIQLDADRLHPGRLVETGLFKQATGTGGVQ